MLELKIYIGTTYIDNQGNEHKIAYHKAVNDIQLEFEDCIIYTTIGQWHYIDETTIVVELIVKPEEVPNIIEKVNTIKENFNQEEILVTKKDVDFIAI